MRSLFLLFALTYVAFAPQPVLRATEPPLVYPATRRVEQLDNFHGTQVADPYRWLESDIRQSNEVAAWAQAQNELTANYIGKIPERASIRDRLRKLWNFERYSSPMHVGAGLAYFRNDGLQNHAVLYVVDTPSASPRPLLDPNEWSTDGTVALSGTKFSPDGKYLAYAVSTAGSDWQTWHVLDVSTGKLLADELKWTKFANIAWTKDSNAFYYNRFEEPPPEEQFQATNRNERVYFHHVGTPQNKDELIYEQTGHPEWRVASLLTPDNAYLILVLHETDDDRHRILFKDLADPHAGFISLIDRFEHQFHFITSDGPVFYFMSNAAAPRRRLIAIDTRTPDTKNWHDIVPQTDDTLIDVGCVGKHFVLTYLHDASSRVRIFTRDGEHVRDVKLPSIGTATGFSGQPDSNETFYSFSSFSTPPTVYRYDVATDMSSPLHATNVDFNPDDYQVEQIFYHSADGTRVPMFISHKGGLTRSVVHPTLLYGYGGYNFALKPWFSVTALAWMEMGGIYAVPNIRGGGEYGAAWHESAIKEKRQTAFNDFIAAAQWLIDNRYTQSSQLAIEGGSNGGLLVAAVLTQRPDLFHACLCEVPLTDMLRFHHFTDGAGGVSEFGSPDVPAEFHALFAYSPYHNVRPGTHYPATLVTTADTDDRAVPLHSFKFVAALQHAQTGSAPILLRVESNAGHGDVGKPTTKRIEEATDELTFLVRNLNMRAD